jgi:hypothetical protein
MKNPHHTGNNSWAMWWGISLGLAFLAAATLSFALDNRGTDVASAVSYAIGQEPVAN